MLGYLCASVFPILVLHCAILSVEMIFGRCLFVRLAQVSCLFIIGGHGIVSAFLCSSLFCRYVTNLQLSIWCCSPARIGVDPSFMLTFQLRGVFSACMMSSA